MRELVVRKLIVFAPVVACLVVLLLLLNRESSAPVSVTRAAVAEFGMDGPQHAVTTYAAINEVSAPAQGRTSDPVAHETEVAAALAPEPLRAGADRDAEAAVSSSASGAADPSPEDVAFAETSDLLARSEALLMVARQDLSRGTQALGTLLQQDDTNLRHLSVSVLRELLLSTGDPEGRIADLLRQAAGDPDAGVAFQARVALNPETAQQAAFGAPAPMTAEPSESDASYP